MKKYFFVSFLLFLPFHSSIAQNTGLKLIEPSPSVVLTGSYEFKSASPIEDIGFVGDAKAAIPANGKVEILKEEDGNVVFRFWDFDDEDSKSKTYNGKVYTIPREEFLQLTKPIYRRFKEATVGAYSVPFRLRGVFKENFDFESSLSLQANLVFGFGTRYQTESWIDLSLGIGLTGVKFTPNNSDVSEERTASAFTVSLGALYKPSAFANVGVFLGWDTLSAADRDANWEHNGKPWLGVGVNISFDKLEGTTEPTNKINK